MKIDADAIYTHSSFYENNSDQHKKSINLNEDNASKYGFTNKIEPKTILECEQDIKIYGYKLSIKGKGGKIFCDNSLNFKNPEGVNIIEYKSKFKFNQDACMLI
jgi:hypothetical protein